MGIFSKLFGRSQKQPQLSYDYQLVWLDMEDEFDLDSQGFVVERTLDSQRLLWQNLPRKEGLESINVTGLSYRKDALQSPEFAPGQWLSLVPEPNNPYDPNAIGVWDKSGTIQVGYIPKTDAKRIGKKLQRGNYHLCLSLNSYNIPAIYTPSRILKAVK